MANDELYHHGIKGMKWGIRRFQNKSGSSRGKRVVKVEPHEDYKKVHSRKSMKTMSDSELRNRINRLQMEKNYTQLSTEHVNKGKQYINKIIKTGTTVATLTTTALTIYNNADKIAGIIKKGDK